MSSFVHLHVHSQFSILDGAADIKAIVAKAKADGSPAVALTDHGNMYGIKLFHDTATAEEIKPILGCEFYVAKNSLTEKTGKDDRSGDHLIILAKNHKGYKNLVKLSSIAFVKGFYYKPRIDKEVLEKHSEGLIVTSACLGGEIPQAIMFETIEKAEEALLWYKRVFGDDFYLELMRHKTGNPAKDRDIYDNQEKVNKVLIELSKKHGVKLVATNDTHFVNAQDAQAHDRLICLNTGKDLDDPTRMQYTFQEYIKSPDEMSKIFADVPEAIANTLEIANKVETFKLNSDAIMPNFPIPEQFTDADDYLKYITYEGAKERWGEMTPEVKERVDFELETIQKMGFPGYFLIVWDFIRAAREMGVLVGPGRGSAAGSAVAYCIKITNIDPIKYDLLFERFLNPDRISMPDIDIDFDDDGRQEVLDWVVKKYGYEKVSHIVTFGTMAAKMAIRDIARVHKLPLFEADKLAKLVPEGPKVTLKKAFDEVPELKDAKKSSNPLIADTLKYAETLEGCIRQTGVHACGIIICRDDLTDHIPVCVAKEADLLVTQFDGRFVEDVGMLKMDFLGLKTLSIMKECVANIKHSKEIDVNIDTISLDDKKTFQLYSEGGTTAIFQFESPGMKKHLRALKPSRFEDLVAMNALYRPGPMDYIPSFIKRKHGEEPIIYDHPIMESYLNDTYGITVYQEQVMLQSRALGGFTRGMSDSLRKAMGKKKIKLMNELKVKFSEGCKANPEFMAGCEKLKKTPDPLIDKIWGDWEAFAKYAFNKSHSVCYAYVSFQTAYLKAHFPAEYMAAVLSNNLSDIKKITIFMDECRRMHLDVKGPDVNESYHKFTVNKKGQIRFGMAAIKGVGEAAVAEIIRERDANGPYKSIFDFVERVNLSAVNKKSIEKLAIAGGFDCFEGLKREHFTAVDDKSNTFLDTLVRYGNNIKSEKNTSQNTLFGGAGNTADIPKPALPNCTEWKTLERLNKEKELVGIYLSAHPLDEYSLELKAFTSISLGDLEDLAAFNGKEIKVGGIVVDIENRTTKTGKPFGSFTVEDYSGQYKFMLFGKDYDSYKEFMILNMPVFVKGKIKEKAYRDGELEFAISKIEHLKNLKERVSNLAIKIPIDKLTEIVVTEIKNFVMNNSGNIDLQFLVYDPENTKTWVSLLSKSHRVSIVREFIDFLDLHEEIEYRIS